jgi:predicted kinase
MRHVAHGNARAAHDAGLPEARIDCWLYGELAAIELLAPWLTTRAANGFVRRAHGDLHLGNLCLWHGTPVPFDAIEFDEAMATIDLGYDLGFLLMDLDHRVTRGAANRVLGRYVARTGDAALTRGLPVFLSMRAMIRAQVEATRGNRDVAAAYLDRALGYLTPPAPVMVAIGGLPATGKSTLARALAPTLGAAPGALVLRSDEIRKRQHGVAPEQRLPESAYSPAASDAVFAELTALANVTAASGHAVIADGMFLNPEQRTSIALAASRAGVGFLGLWLTAPRDVLEARLASRTGDASDATVAVLQAVVRNDRGGGDWLAIDATDAAAALAQVQQLAEVQQAVQTRFGSHVRQQTC